MVILLSSNNWAFSCLSTFFLLGKIIPETVILQTTYTDTTMSKIQVHKWLSCSKKGQLLLEDQPSSRWSCPKQMKSSLKFMNLSWRTITEQSTNSSVLSMNFEWENVNEKSFNKICAALAHRRSKPVMNLKNRTWFCTLWPFFLFPEMKTVLMFYSYIRNEEESDSSIKMHQVARRLNYL